MIYKRMVSLLEDQLKLGAEREKKQAVQIASLTASVNRQSVQIEELTATVQSLQEALLRKNGKVEGLENKNRGLAKIAFPQSEKQTPEPKPVKAVAPSPAERGNNNARRKEYFDLETRIHELNPVSPAFDKTRATLISHTDSIRYEYTPPRFVKHIYRQYTYRQAEILLSGRAPEAPLLNSSYDGSFIAGLLQLRFLYSLPVERIIHLFKESGFELNKATAHGLIAKSCALLEKLDEAMHRAILEDTYISMDESYHNVLTDQKNSKGKYVTKGYIWAALGNTNQLIHFFYDQGSRSRKVLTDYIPKTYRGAIQSDGYIDYRILEGDEYPGVTRLGCLQHCRRKFFDIETDPDAARILELMAGVYHHEHLIDKEWPPSKRLNYRKKHILPLFDKLHRELLRIKQDPLLLASSQLADGVDYTLNQWEAIKAYTGHPDYAPDNNAMERNMRYISLSRRNSLFFGSHKGAKRAALFYSLACSCRLHKVNTFEYFADILNRMPTIKPQEPIQTFRELLPDKWIKSAKG